MNSTDHELPHYMSLVFALLGKGYRLDIQAVGRASFHAKVFNRQDQGVGTLDYRSIGDESQRYAQGISYGSCSTDPQYEYDATFTFIVERM